MLSDDHSCRDAVTRILAHRAANGLGTYSPNTAAGYCNARGRLPAGVLGTLAKRAARGLRAGPPSRGGTGAVGWVIGTSGVLGFYRVRSASLLKAGGWPDHLRSAQAHCKLEPVRPLWSAFARNSLLAIVRLLSQNDSSHRTFRTVGRSYASLSRRN